MIVRAENVAKRYFRATGQANYFEAVRPLSLTLAPGAVTVLTGRSGSGKTTLLHLLSGLLTPDAGKVYYDDTDLYALGDAALSAFRNEKIGVVPQGRSAVDTLTVMENVLLPYQLSGRTPPREEAERWLEALGVSHLRDAWPRELSGGELRRMAIARALTGAPRVILADEPTGDLDDENTRRVLDLLRAAAHEEGRTVLLVTHEDDAMSYADQAFRMDGGVLTPLEGPSHQ